MPRKPMNPLSLDLGEALLLRHRTLCSKMPKREEDVTEENVSAAIISYKNLLVSIGAPESLAQNIGTYLFQIAEWCEDRGYPPLNALAVNGSLQSPGAGYYLAPGGNKWNDEVRACIAWNHYPLHIAD